MSEANYILSTPRLGLRRWRPADLEPFAAMNADRAVMEYFPSLMSVTETAAFVQRIEVFFEENGYGLYVVEQLATREFLGFTGFSHPSFECWFTPCVEIGWRFKRGAWGQGYASEAAAACLQHGFQTLGLTTIYSWTAVVNTKSERVMRRIGMQNIDEFEHPKIAEGHVLRRHVLYGIGSGEVLRQSTS